MLVVRDLRAEDRKYVLGTTLDLVAGGMSGRNVIFRNTGSSGRPGSFFYQIYPATQLRALGAHSTFELSYAFGLSRLNSDVAYDSNSHALSATFNSAIGPDWKLSLTDS